MLIDAFEPGMIERLLPGQKVSFGTPPSVEGYKDSEAFGLRFNFADPLGLHSLDVTAAYTPDSALDRVRREIVARQTRQADRGQRQPGRCEDKR